MSTPVTKASRPSTMFQLANCTPGNASSTPYTSSHTPASSRPRFLVNRMVVMCPNPFGKSVPDLRPAGKETLLRPQIAKQSLEIASRVEQLTDLPQHGHAPRLGRHQGLELGEPSGDVFD